LTVEDRRSYCRICAAACGILVTVDGERVLRVRGDADHPVSRGYTCAKGRGLAAWHHGPDRIDRPRLDGRDAPWAEVLDDLGSRLRTVIDGSGADAVATYLATGLAYDSAGQVATGGFMRALGSTSFYSAATVDNAPVLVAADLVAGNPMLNPVWDPTAPGLLLLVGTNPVVSHGYGTALPDPVRHLREYRARGGEIWVVDPRRTETAALADEHLAVRPGSDVALLAAVVAALLADGPPADEPCRSDDLDRLRAAFAAWRPARAAAAAGVEVDAVERLVDVVLARRGRIAAMCGTGTTMAADGILVEWLRWLLLVLSGSLDRPGGMHFHRGLVQQLRPPRVSGRPAAPGPRSRPELPRMAGQLPAVALADEIEAGNVRALLVTGGNPILAFPEPDRLRAALARLDVLAVVDVAEHELTALATHVLPATGQLERADVSIAELTAVRCGLQATGAVVPAVGERRPVWWILGSLAPRVGLDVLGGASPEDLTDERFLHGLLARSPVDAVDLFARGPHGIGLPVEHGWVRATMLPGGYWRIAPPELLTRLAAHREPAVGLVLVPRRETEWNNSVRSAGPGTEPVVRVHPDDAAAAGLVDAGRVTVRSAHGTVTASLRADANVRPGVVAMTHGHAASSPGRLTSAHADVDPLTTMPRAGGLPVTLEPAD
jgi:anaerobic selenocysteine-containing dehydrogenase